MSGVRGFRRGAAALLACVSGGAEAQETNWRAAAVGDVEAGYRLFVDNHPGMHDPVNPAFPQQLAKAREAALAVARTARNEQDYARALGTFSAGLQDGHAKLVLKAPDNGAPASEFLWPGFVAAWRGSALKVHQADARFAMPVGSEIAACDGAPIKDVIASNLVPMAFRSAEGGQWWFWSPHVFLPATTRADGKPKRCAFVAPDGTRRILDLAWSPAPADAGERVARATDGERTAIGLTEPREGLFLIGLPDFHPNEEGVAAYRALFNTLKARNAELNAARAVVIDLRFNNGGSSTWSRRAASAIWGEPQVEAAMNDYLKDIEIWWRASQGNTDYVTGLEPILRENGNEQIADMIGLIGAGMRAALGNGQPFYVEADDDEEAAGGPESASPFTVPVYVITPGRCGSACLDAVDTFTRFPNVKLIGAPTSADSTYMEVRSADLPSGKGRIVIPNKVWMGRPRESGQFYTPDIVVTDLDWSTATFLDHVEKDLAVRSEGP